MNRHDLFVGLTISALILFNIFDAVSTIVFLKFFEARELNPFMAALYDWSPGTFLVVKLGYTGLVASLAWKTRQVSAILPVTLGVTAAYGVLFSYQIVLALYVKDW